jgi:hypothetical protein
MAVAIVQDFPEEETDRSTTNYDAIHEKIMSSGTEPTGMLIHTAGFTGNGFRIFEVWETKEQFERFMADVVMPAVMEVTAGDPGREPVLTVYELHSVVVP